MYALRNYFIMNPAVKRVSDFYLRTIHRTYSVFGELGINQTRREVNVYSRLYRFNPYNRLLYLSLHGF